MKKKYKVMLLILGILLAIALATGSSYAYWIYTAVQEGTNTAVSDCFALTFTDANDIHLENTVPMSESEGKELVPYTFTIKNVCNHAADYDVNIETLEGSTLDINYLRYKLDNRKSKILGSIEDNESIDFVNDNAIRSNNIANGTLESNEEKTFNLRLWIDEDSTVEQSASKTYESKVVIIASLNAHYSSTMLIKGQDFNYTIKQLANPDDKIVSYYEDTKVKDILFADSLPDESIKKVNVSTSEDKPVYAWFDTDTIYLYSNSEKIYMNTDSSSMFKRMKSLTTLNLNLFDTSKVANMSKMLEYCTSLESIDLNDFDTSNVTNMSYMFSLSSFISLDLSNFDTSNVTDMSGMFDSMYYLKTLDISNFDTSNVTNMSNMFQNMSSLKTLDLSNFDTSNVTDMSYMFYQLKIYSDLDLGMFDTSKVTYMQMMFSNSSFRTIDLSSFDTSNVTNMSNMFSGMQHLTNLDLSSFDTSNVTDMNNMFRADENLTNLNLSSFDTSKVTNMSWMFERNLAITYLDLSSFDTSKVTNMTYMFNDNKLLTTIVVSNKWNTNMVTSSILLFKNCNKLVGGAGTTYDSNHYDLEYARIDDPDNGKPGYFTLKTT